ncbi:RNA polymerase II [Phytophthora cinnamomi]|uniref:RNA polymerase II n=1 Tax=Phytophthora cinnamomi TaxID=4785 RepID=UPI00355A6DEF|nr:RNA polymerase II [Phytophthora cinnamomi]
MAFSSRPVMDSKDAAALNLGDDFEDDVCLSNAEVAIILEKQKANYLEQKKTFTSAFKKTESYVLRFTGTSDPVVNQASVIELREALQSIWFEHDEEVHRLEEFEIACLSNLNPEGVEEAVTLIPSLPKHFTDNEIEEILSLISRMTAKMLH